MSYTKLLWTCLLCFSIFISTGWAQKSLDGVAKIEVYDDDGNLIETGAGIVAGVRGSQLFVVTAFHVIDVGSVFQVSFNNRQWESFSGSIHEKFNDDLDYGVLIVDVPPNIIKTHSFHQPEYSKIESGNKVHMVGHPGAKEWTNNIQNVITNPQSGTFEVALSNVGIEPGYSGGAVLSARKNHLIGLIVDVSTNNTIAVRIDQILRDLKSWGIPYTFILPYKPPRKASAYVFAVLAAGATVGAVYFNSEKDRIYDIYSEQKDPAAPVYTDSANADYVGPRSEAFQEAKDNQNNSYYAAGAAGGLALTSILLSKRKYKQQDESLSYQYNQLDLLLGGASFAIVYNF